MIKDALLKKLIFLQHQVIFQGPGSREEAGLPKDTGPYRVVTNLCVMGYDDESKEMKLTQFEPRSNG